MKLGVVLSGGGIRGVSHIGFLKALEEIGVQPDCYAGTSIGALGSVLAASGYSADEILEIAKENKIYKLIKPNWPQLGLGTLGKIPNMLSDLISEDDFDALNKPVAVSVSNITAGKSELISSGPLFEVVQASCSIPILFKPVEMNGHYYVDGGILNNFPSQAFRHECEVLIGMDLVSGNPLDKEGINSLFKMTVRTFELAISKNAREGKEMCDLVITPERVADQPVLYTNNLDALYDIGYETTQQHIETIKKLVHD